MVPDIWRAAKLAALFKKDSGEKPGNYRSGGQMLVMRRLLEKFREIDSSILRITGSAGFVRGRYCQIILKLPEVTNCIDVGSMFHMIMDFQ